MTIQRRNAQIRSGSDGELAPCQVDWNGLEESSVKARQVKLSACRIPNRSYSSELTVD
jgi:hypothetical protein